MIISANEKVPLEKSNYKNLTIAILKGVNIDSVTDEKMQEFETQKIKFLYQI